MKRTLPEVTTFLKKTRFKCENEENNYPFLRENNMKKIDSKNDLYDFYLSNCYFEIGTKIGLIYASKFKNDIKKNPEYIDYYFNVYHDKHIYSYIDDFCSNSTSLDYTSLIEDKVKLNKYLHILNNGFKSSFINYLSLNLKNFPIIIQKLNFYNIYKFIIFFHYIYYYDI